MDMEIQHTEFCQSSVSPCIMCVQYIGGCSVHRGLFNTSGGYRHEYIGGFNHSSYAVKTEIFLKEQSYINVSYLLRQHTKLF